MIDITLNLATVSELNSRDHWRKRSARAKLQRQQTKLTILSEQFAKKANLEMPLRVTLTRLSPRYLDSDNLQGAFKHVRDGVADAVGVDDRDPRYDWQYRQLKAERKGVRIVIERVA